MAHQFELGDPNVICTRTYGDKLFDLPTYKVGLFSVEQAETFFSLDLKHDKFMVYAINEDEMKIERVVNMEQALRFFKGPQP